MYMYQSIVYAKTIATQKSYLDSGNSHHICKDESKFSNLVYYHKPEIVMTGNMGYKPIFGYRKASVFENVLLTWEMVISLGLLIQSVVIK